MSFLYIGGNQLKEMTQLINNNICSTSKLFAATLKKTYKKHFQDIMD